MFNFHCYLSIFFLFKDGLSFPYKQYQLAEFARAIGRIFFALQMHVLEKCGLQNRTGCKLNIHAI
jgi:hypothetical protein